MKWNYVNKKDFLLLEKNTQNETKEPAENFKMASSNYIQVEGVSKKETMKTRNTKILTSDEAITLKATKMDALSEKCKNELDPTDKSGAMS